MELLVKTTPQKELFYPIIIDESLLEKAGEYINKYSSANKFLIVTNDTVFKLWGNVLNIPNSSVLVIPDGESFKNFDSLNLILNKALELKLERKDAIVAFGGGVIGDMAGFAASIYQRGIDFIQIPTTLLAQVDSSVGGKVAINHPLGKNLIGAFYQPKLVLADISVLGTLDIRQMKTGLAEVVKYAFIETSCNSENEYNFFNFLKENSAKIIDRDLSTLQELIYICCSLKSAVVVQDEKEKGLRAILNFGHTFAHALEKVTEYTFYTHGEAVAIGMKMALNLAYQKNLITSNYLDMGLSLIEQYGLEISVNKSITLQQVYEAMKLDKKVDSNNIRFILPTGYQKVDIFDDVDEELIKKVVSQEL